MSFSAISFYSITVSSHGRSYLYKYDKITIKKGIFVTLNICFVLDLLLSSCCFKQCCTGGYEASSVFCVLPQVTMLGMEGQEPLVLMGNAWGKINVTDCGKVAVLFHRYFMDNMVQ